MNTSTAASSATDTSFSDVEAQLDLLGLADDSAMGARERADQMLALAERVLSSWVLARGDVPTDEQREGFRLLALHRQGARGEPSFNACRETCREVAYHYNLLTGEQSPEQASAQLLMMSMLVRHLFLFVQGKLQESSLGDFCCSSRPVRSMDGVKGA